MYKNCNQVHTDASLSLSTTWPHCEDCRHNNDTYKMMHGAQQLRGTLFLVIDRVVAQLKCYVQLLDDILLCITQGFILRFAFWTLLLYDYIEVFRSSLDARDVHLGMSYYYSWTSTVSSDLQPHGSSALMNRLDSFTFLNDLASSDTRSVSARVNGTWWGHPMNIIEYQVN